MSYDIDFAGGWTLDVVELDGLPTAWLTNAGVATGFYEHTFSDNAPLDLLTFDYDVQLAFDQTGAPYVLWAPPRRGAPFVWACAAGGAGWPGRLV